MKRAVITGSQGFVGKYLRRELENNGYECVGIDIREGEGAIAADLLNYEQIQEVLFQLKPEVLFHLAGQANVAKSWSMPQKTVEVNVIASINLLEAIKKVQPCCRTVMVGSSDQYGSLGAAGERVTENLVVNPQTPYAVSKAAQEEMAKVYTRAYGMNICMTRSFNHGGAGQARGFMISDFASGIVEVECGKAPCLRVGNLTVRRDFTHVKDVVRAYRLIAEKGSSGEVYNVGSGVTYSAQEILDELCALAVCPIVVEQDPAKMRPSDTPVICCDHKKLTAHTGWEPQISMTVMLRETIDYWRKKIR